MKSLKNLLSFFAAGFIALAAGCHEPGTVPTGTLSSSPQEDTASTNPSSPTPGRPKGSPQPKLPTVKLWVGPAEVEAEIAGTPRQIATGMMFRESMTDQEAMLFVFAKPHRTSFFMKNTQLPLSCAYINPEGEILEIHDMTPFDESPIEASSDRIQYVLEVPQGWFQRHHVTTGAVIQTESGSLQETFFP